MAESTIDIIINPRRAIEGARQVIASLDRIGISASSVTNKLHTRFDQIRRSLFSLQSAIIAIGIGAFAKSLLDVGRNADLAERSLRSVTTSAGHAAVIMERIRGIADKFGFEDLELARAFRVLAANDVPNAEKALKSIANVALDTGESVQESVNAILSANPKALRDLGVRILDLGTGRVTVAFKNMTRDVENTNSAIRDMILQMLTAVPDASTRMGNSIDFQIKRMQNRFEDFKKAMMEEGGLNSFITAGINQFLDSFSGDDVKQKGKAAGEAIQEILKTIMRDVAFVMDALTPLAKLLYSIINSAVKQFNALPPEIQTLGIVATLWFGTRGLLVITAGLALIDKLNDESTNMAQNLKNWSQDFGDTGLGEALKDVFTALGLGHRKFEEVTPREQKLQEMLGFAGNGKPSILGEGAFAKQTIPEIEDPSKGTGGKSFSQRAEEYIKGLEDKKKAADALREAQKQQAAAEQAAGKSGLQHAQLNETWKVTTDRLRLLTEQTEDYIKVEEGRRNVLFDEDAANAAEKKLEFLNKLKADGFALEKLGTEEAKGFKIVLDAILQRQAQASRETKAWAEAEAEKKQRIEETNSFLSSTVMALQEAKDANDLMKIPLEERDLENQKLIFKRELMKGHLLLSEQEKAEHLEKLRQLDEELKKNRQLNAMEAARQQHAVTMLQISNKILDIEDAQGQGTDAASFRTQLSERIQQRELTTGLPVGEKERAEIEQQVLEERMGMRDLEVKSTMNNLDKEISAQRDLLATYGLSRKEREVQLRLRQEEEALRLRGIQLSDIEKQKLEEHVRVLQDNADAIKVGEAVQSFVDSFEVGWDKIVKSGEQAYGHLEDALVKFVQTGKMEFDDFANYITQELIRLGIRASINQLIGGGSSGGGGLLSGLFNTGGGGGGGGGGSFFDMFKGPGFGAANSGGGGGGNFSGGGGGIGFDVTDWNQRGGIVDAHGSWPIQRFQRGGVNTHQRLISISEGHTPEAIIPLRGGKVPVEVKGGRGVTISAPITIMTPDVHGVRRSVQQVQAELSSTLARASRRIN